MNTIVVLEMKRYGISEIDDFPACHPELKQKTALALLLVSMELLGKWDRN